MASKIFVQDLSSKWSPHDRTFLVNWSISQEANLVTTSGSFVTQIESVTELRVSCSCKDMEGRLRPGMRASAQCTTAPTCDPQLLIRVRVDVQVYD